MNKRSFIQAGATIPCDAVTFNRLVTRAFSPNISRQKRSTSLETSIEEEEEVEEAEGTLEPVVVTVATDAEGAVAVDEAVDVEE